MSEWWTYRLSSFLLFSPRTWSRLLERYNAEIWPLQLVALALGVAMFAFAARGEARPSRWIPAALAAFWIWIAFGFHVRHYASINWAATYFAAAFVVEGVLLAWFGVLRGALTLRREASPAKRAGLAILGFALLGEPALAWATGQPPDRLQYFGVAPDPTAVATLGIALAAARPLKRLLVVPILWCLVSGGFAWAMGSRDALALPLAAVAAGIFAWLPAAKDRRVGSTPASPGPH